MILSIAAVRLACTRDDAARPKIGTPTETRGGGEAEARQFRFVGTGACSAPGCHGDPYKSGDSHESAEFSFWFQHDPHADALASIDGPKGRSIIDRLMRAAPASRRAEVTAGCLRCHSDAEADATVDAISIGSANKIGCESCHGAASGWVNAHHRSPWKQLKAGQKAALGFRNLEDPLLLAQTCTKCHVGSKDRQVNHDSFAAGHPYIRFELRNSLEWLPQHWNDIKIRDAGQSVAVRRWMHGQWTAASAALEVLESRTGSTAEPASPWPEFSEYDCFACHHALRMNDFGGGHSVKVDMKDVVPWGRRFIPAVESLAARDPAATDVRPILQSLRQAMQREWVPDQKAVGRLAAVARDRIQRLRFEERIDRANSIISEAIESVSTMWTDIAAQPLNWNQMAEIYLFMLAIDQDHHDELRRDGTVATASDREITKAIERFRVSLEFPTGYFSPKGFDRVEGISNGRSPSGEIARGLVEMLRKRAKLSIP